MGSLAAAALAGGLSSAGGPDGLAADRVAALLVQPRQTSVAARLINRVCGFMTSPVVSGELRSEPMKPVRTQRARKVAPRRPFKISDPGHVARRPPLQTRVFDEQLPRTIIVSDPFFVA